jgi:hypothetical protein
MYQGIYADGRWRRRRNGLTNKFIYATYGNFSIIANYALIGSEASTMASIIVGEGGPHHRLHEQRRGCGLPGARF